jgi:Ca-activated chloride channel family protein
MMNTLVRTTTAMILLVLAGATAARADEGSDAGRMMLVLDSSGSMKEKSAGGDTKIAAAKEALDAVIDDLPADQPVGLRVYGAKVFSRSDKGACTDTQRVVDLGTDNRESLKTQVKKYKPYGETPIGNALKAAGEDLGDDGRRSIVLVSDGEATCAPDPCKVAEELSAHGIDLTIDVVGLDVSGKARQQLRCIADEGHGSYYDADDAGDLTSALATVAERAARPYAAIGRPITGGSDATQATTVTAGDWRDVLGAQGRATGERWYHFTRTIARSTIHLSATLANRADKDALNVRMFAGTVDCGYGDASAPSDYRPFVVASLAMPGSKAFQDECVEDKELTIAIARGLPSGNSWSDDADSVVEIRIIEEPPASNAQSLPKRLGEQPETKPDMSNPTTIIGGNSFGNAVEIEPGAYSGTLVPGEAQLFEVDADWGQRVIAAADVPPPNGALAEKIGNTGPQTTLWIYSPSRAAASSAFHHNNQQLLSKNQGADLYGHTYGIGYNNRTSFVAPQEAASIAGKYYISIAMAATDNPGDTYEVPFTLGVDTVGEINGAPVYVGGEPTIGATNDDKHEVKKAASASDSSIPWLSIGLAAAGVTLLAVAAAVVSKQRRSKT